MLDAADYCGGHAMKDFVKRYYPNIIAFQKQVNSFVEDVVHAVPTDLFGAGSFEPRIQVTQTPEVVRAFVELPGVQASDIEITATPHSFHISGRKPECPLSEGEVLVNSEIRSGHFDRVCALPSRVNDASVKATFKDGILALEFEKLASAAEEPKPVSISGH